MIFLIKFTRKFSIFKSTIIIKKKKKTLVTEKVIQSIELNMFEAPSLILAPHIQNSTGLILSWHIYSLL